MPSITWIDSTTEVREGESVDVFLVRVNNHQHSVTFGAYWHTDAGTAGTSDYVHQDTGAIGGNDSERRANRAKRTFRTRKDNLLEGNETFTARFSPVRRNVEDIGTTPPRDEKCELTILDADPNITEYRHYLGTGDGTTTPTASARPSRSRPPSAPAWMWTGTRAWGSRSTPTGGPPATSAVPAPTSWSSDTPSSRRTATPTASSMPGGYQDSNDGRWHNLVNRPYRHHRRRRCRRRRRTRRSLPGLLRHR